MTSDTLQKERHHENNQEAQAKPHRHDPHIMKAHICTRRTPYYPLGTGEAGLSNMVPAASAIGPRVAEALQESQKTRGSAKAEYSEDLRHF